MKRIFLLFMCVVLLLPTVLAETLLVKRCPSCGWQIDSSWEGIDFARVKYCGNCGSGVQEAAADESPVLQTEIGDVITFGHYEQDGDLSNGAEEIEWIVLDKKDNQILVISKYGLDDKPYNNGVTSVTTWAYCTLCKWLNNDFLKSAFSSEEQAMIPNVKVAAHKNPDYDTYPGNDTQDQVFLLSIPEVNQYFTSDSARKCQATAYADTYRDFCSWWLRSPGRDQDYAAYVGYGGGVFEYGCLVNYGHNAVRPALWINLNP